MTATTNNDASAAQTAESVLSFWFKDEDTGRMDLPQGKRWFLGGKELDALLEERFGATVVLAREGHLQHWQESAHSALALIILLDQFNRNIYRGTADAFAADSQALAVCHHALAMDYPAQYTLTQRVFCYLPLEHDESTESQESSVALFTELAENAPPQLREYANGTLEYAHEHKKIIDQFGRYPYRNEVLGRTSTPAELAWLEQSGKRFGQ